MRPGIRVVNLVLLASTGLFTVAALPAQSLTPCVRSMVFTIGQQVFIGARAGGHAPAYTATIKSTFERALADGNTIHWTAESIEARDEAGRTVRHGVQGCDVDADGQQQLRTDANIFDPVANTSTHWNTGPGTMALVTVTHQRTSSSHPDWKEIPHAPPVQYHPQVTSEDLGTRTIAGMQATGTRATEIIAAGADGNDMPLKIVNETWMNKENHTILMRVQDDPRYGRSTWEVENLTLGPPDPALFTPPANYKVWDPDAQTQPQTTAETGR
jgi:hypothetical protein